MAHTSHRVHLAGCAHSERSRVHVECRCASIGRRPPPPPTERRMSDTAPARQSVEHVHRMIRESILDGSLTPGETMSQVALADELGVSRTPLREALRMLQGEGLILSEPNRRVRVAPLSLADVEELYAIRIPLEVTALRLSIARMTPEDIAELEGYMAAMAHFAGDEDYARWYVPHQAFHRGADPARGRALRRAAAPALRPRRALPAHALRPPVLRRSRRPTTARSWTPARPPTPTSRPRCSGATWRARSTGSSRSSSPSTTSPRCARSWRTSRRRPVTRPPSAARRDRRRQEAPPRRVADGARRPRPQGAPRRCPRAGRPRRRPGCAASPTFSISASTTSPGLR